MTEDKIFEVGTKTRKHVIQQLSTIEKVKKMYDPMLWAMMMMYIVVGTGYPLLDTGQYLILLLEVIVFLFLTMFIYVKVDKMKQAATEGRLYADIRNNIGTDEIMEQATIKDIFTLVVPGDPYPWHSVMIDFDEVEPLFKSLGEDVKIKSTTEVQEDIDAYIKAEAKRLSDEMKKKDKKEKDQKKSEEKALKSSIREQRKAFRKKLREEKKEKKEEDDEIVLDKETPRRKLIKRLAKNYEKYSKDEKDKDEMVVLETTGGSESGMSYPSVEFGGTDPISPLVSVKGVSENLAPKLLRIGITTIEGLANADAEFVGKIKYLGTARAQKLIDEAKRMIESKGDE